MLTRRHTLALGATGFAAALVSPAFAQDWKAKYPELVFAIIPAENASGVTERYAPFVAYLSKELGTKVTLLEQLKLGYDKAGINIPYPQQDMHLYLHGKDGSVTRAEALVRDPR